MHKSRPAGQTNAQWNGHPLMRTETAGTASLRRHSNRDKKNTSIILHHNAKIKASVVIVPAKGPRDACMHPVIARAGRASAYIKAARPSCAAKYGTPASNRAAARGSASAATRVAPEYLHPSHDQISVYTSQTHASAVGSSTSTMNLALATRAKHIDQVFRKQRARARRRTSKRCPRRQSRARSRPRRGTRQSRRPPRSSPAQYSRPIARRARAGPAADAAHPHHSGLHAGHQ